MTPDQRIELVSLAVNLRFAAHSGGRAEEEYLAGRIEKPARAEVVERETAAFDLLLARIFDAFSSEAGGGGG